MAVSLFSDAGNAVFTPAMAEIETVRPPDEASLGEILVLASNQGTPVTFTAALTGLTGSAVPSESGIRIDLGGFDTIPDRAGWRRVTPFLLLSEADSSQGLVAPGVSLETLNHALEELAYWYPPHPGEVRASIGGNVSTNASGPRTFAFGATREYVVSLRILLADGDVLTLRRGDVFAKGRRYALRTASGRLLEGELPDYDQPSVKNAAGLFVTPDMDLIDLFIGSEGILGVFTEIGLRFLPRRAIRSEILFFGSPEEALACADGLRPLKCRGGTRAGFDSLGQIEGLISLEFFDKGSIDLVRHDARFSDVIPLDAGAALEVEFFADDPTIEVKVFGLAERLGCRGFLPPDRSSAFRYAVPRRVAELLKERGQPKFGTDFAVPLSSFRELYEFYEVMDAEFGPGSDRENSTVRTAKWGHVGDCHLHCNFMCESSEDQVLARSIYLKLVRKAVSLGGTISAEHGVGKKSLPDESGIVHPYLWYQYGDRFRQIATVKRVFDPKGILNRGNMVPADV